MADQQKNPGCLSVLAVLFLGVILYAVVDDWKNPHVPPSAEQQAEARRQAEAAGRVATVLQSIKSAARDAASVDFHSILATRDASVVCVEYRARNGFGGLNKEIAVLAGGKLSQKVADWNRHCAGKSLDDFLYVRQMVR